VNKCTVQFILAYKDNLRTKLPPFRRILVQSTLP